MQHHRTNERLPAILYLIIIRCSEPIKGDRGRGSSLKLRHPRRRSMCACDSFEPVDARSKAKHGTYAPLLAHRGSDTARIEFLDDVLQLYRAARSNLCHDRCEFYRLRVGPHLARLRPATPLLPMSLAGH
jgi:hypothetical protein